MNNLQQLHKRLAGSYFPGNSDKTLNVVREHKWGSVALAAQNDQYKQSKYFHSAKRGKFGKHWTIEIAMTKTD